MWMFFKFLFALLYSVGRTHLRLNDLDKCSLLLLLLLLLVKAVHILFNFIIVLIVFCVRRSIVYLFWFDTMVDIHGAGKLSLLLLPLFSLLSSACVGAFLPSLPLFSLLSSVCVGPSLPLFSLLSSACGGVFLPSSLSLLLVSVRRSPHHCSHCCCLLLVSVPHYPHYHCSHCCLLLVSVSFYLRHCSFCWCRPLITLITIVLIAAFSLCLAREHTGSGGLPGQQDSMSPHHGHQAGEVPGLAQRPDQAGRHAPGPLPHPSVYTEMQKAATAMAQAQGQGSLLPHNMMGPQGHGGHSGAQRARRARRALAGDGAHGRPSQRHGWGRGPDAVRVSDLMSFERERERG